MSAPRRSSLAILLLLAACGGTVTTEPATSAAPSEVHVLGAIIALGTGRQAILGFSAHNAGPTTDQLTGATCTCAARAEQVGAGTIEPEVTGMFGPDGDHVILLGVDKDLAVGDFADVTLTFAVAGEVTTQAEVVRG